MSRLLRTFRFHLTRCFVKALSDRQRRILAWRLLEMVPGVRSVEFDSHGLHWNARPHEFVEFSLFADGGYHGAEITALLAWMRRSGVLAPPRDVFVDAGANIGTTCVPMVHAAGCRGLAIEPIRDNISLLRKNVECNGLTPRVTIVNKAISLERGTLRMCLIKGTSSGHFVASGGEKDFPQDRIAGFEETESDGLYAIVSAAGFAVSDIAMVWSDVQGCERDVIESGAALWAAGVPLWAEVEPRSLRLQGTLETFTKGAAGHFDRFILAHDLVESGEKPRPRPVGEMEPIIRAMSTKEANVDALFLPPSLKLP